MAVDPGEHVLRYETAGYPPVEDHVVIAAGDRNRVLSVRFAQAAAVPVLPATPAPTSRGPAVPIATWVFGGVAVAAFATEAYFGIAGLDQRSRDLSGPDHCSPQCSSSEKSSIQTKFIVADVSLGVGVVAAGLATYFFFRGHHDVEPNGTAIDFTPRPGGGVASIGGRF
jgi:hypothetical protein